MGATHEIRVVGAGGQEQVLRLDATDPEQAATIAAAGANARSLSAQERSAVEHQAQVDARSDSLEQLPGASVLNPIASAAVGIADEWTLGTVREHLPDSVGLSAEALETDHPVGYMGGRLGAALIPALLTGGESLTARGGLAAMAARVTPGGLGAAAGNSVSRAIAARLAARGLGPRTIGMAAGASGAAVDGLVAGLAQEVTESNLQGTPLEGERLLGSGLFGASLGLGVGALLGGALPGAVPGVRGALAGRAAHDLQSLEGVAVAQSIPEEVFLGVDRASPNFWREIGEAATQLPPENRSAWVRAISGGLPSESQRTALRRVIEYGPRAFDQGAFTEAVTTMANRFDAVSNAAEDGLVVARSGLQRQAVLRAGVDNSTAALTSGRNAVAMAAAEVEEAIAVGGLGTSRPWARQLQRALSGASEQGGSGDLIAAVDDILANPNFIPHASDAAANQVWAGARQRLLAAGDAVNPRFRSLRDALDQFDVAEANSSMFRTQERSVGQGGRRTFRHNPATLNNNFSSSAYHTRGTNVDNLLAYMERSDDLLAELEGLGVDVAAQRASIRSAANDIVPIMRWGSVVSDANFLSAVESQGAGIQAAIGHGAIGAVMGAVVGGPLGGLAGAAAGTAMAVYGHPIGLARQLAALKTTLGRTESRMAQGATRVRSALSSPRFVASGTAGRRIPQVLVRLRDPKAREEEYGTMVTQLRDLAGNPDMLADRIDKVAGTIGRVAPDAGTAMAVSMAAGVHYLVDNLPPSELPSLFGRRSTRPSTAEMIEFTRRVEAIEDPYSLLDRTADGTLHEAHVDAVRAVYPRLYAAIQQEITSIVGELDQARAVPYALRTRVGLLLGVPADPTLDPRFIFAMQQSYSQTSAQRAAQGPREGSFTVSARVANDTMSRASRLTHSL